jgi:hypothetical protein
VTPRERSEKRRLPVAPGGGTLRRRARVVPQLEQRELAELLGAPRFKLLAAQFDETRQTMGARVNDDRVRPRHGRSRCVGLGDLLRLRHELLDLNLKQGRPP